MKIGIWQLLIIFLIVLLLFGTKRLASIGRDLGNALKGFRETVREPAKEEPVEKSPVEHRDSDRMIEGKIEPTEKKRT